VIAATVPPSLPNAIAVRDCSARVRVSQPSIRCVSKPMLRQSLISAYPVTIELRITIKTGTAAARRMESAPLYLAGSPASEVEIFFLYSSPFDRIRASLSVSTRRSSITSFPPMITVRTSEAFSA
jgi:hypothetical protein